MSKRTRLVSISALLILAVFALGVFNVQGYQATQPGFASKYVPPAPTAPYWFYRTHGSVEAVAVSRDGATVVAGSSYPDHKVYVFGRQTNTTLWTYNFNAGDITAVAASDNGSTIVAGGYQYVRVFGRQSNATIWTYKTSSEINSVAISGDGNTTAAGGDDGNIYVFGGQSNTTIWTYNTNARIYSVAVSADGSTIVSGDGSSYGHVRAFGRQSNATLWTYKAGSYIQRVAVSANGSTVVAGSFDFRVYVFGRQSNTTIWTYRMANPADCVSVSADGNTIAAGCMTGNLTVFARAGNTTLINYNTNSEVFSAVAASSDGSTIACGGWGRPIHGSYPRARLFSRNLGLLWSYNVGGNISTSIWGPAAGISGDGTLAAYGSDNDMISVFQYDYIPPVLGSPTVSPSTPLAGEPISISISVTDNHIVSFVALYYKVNGAGSWSEFATTHAGAIYTGTIGPFSYGDNVTYYFNATDGYSSAVSPSNAPLSCYSFLVGQASSGGGGEGTGPLSIIILASVVGVVVIVSIVILIQRGKTSRQGRKTK